MINCVNRKSEIRIHEILSNGQHFNLYIKRYNASPAGDGIKFIWRLALIISNSRKESNLWFNNKNKKFNNKSTGKCGLEGLQRALFYVLDFSNKLKINEELQICWSDERRHKVYRYLHRYGFEEYGDCFAIRNPKYWEMG